jgi:3-hydroxyacyl-[acyl-carrier-protein] dehydratase
MNKIFNELLSAIIIENKTDKTISSHFSVGKEFIGFQGHFPEQPVMPGICMFELIKVLLYKGTGKKYKLEKVGNSKFFSPIINDETIQIESTLTLKKTGLLHVKSTLKKGDEQKSVLSLFFSEVK